MQTEIVSRIWYANKHQYIYTVWVSEITFFIWWCMKAIWYAAHISIGLKCVIQYARVVSADFIDVTMLITRVTFRALDWPMYVHWNAGVLCMAAHQKISNDGIFKVSSDRISNRMKFESMEYEWAWMVLLNSVYLFLQCVLML